MYTETLLESLIQKSYEAATGTIAWETFLMSLASALDSRYPCLYSADTSTRQSEIAVSLQMNEKWQRAYNDHYQQRNVWIAQGKHLLQPGIVHTGEMACPRRIYLASEWYADFCKPLEMTQGLGVTLLKDQTMTSNIGVFTDNRRPAYGEDDFALLRALVPHLQRGLKMHRHLAASQARGQALEAVLNGLSVPVILVTDKGKVLFMNTAAERLIRASDGLVVEDGELRALLPEDTKSLRNLLGGAAQTSAGRGRKSGGTLRISRPSTRAPLEILISPLPIRQDDWIVRQPPVAAVFVTDLSRVAIAVDSVLMRVHGLTASEAKVAVAVSRGLAGKEICRELDISYNTLKTHLKRIYAKTGTKHQSHLIRLLAGEFRFSRSEDKSTDG